MKINWYDVLKFLVGALAGVLGMTVSGCATFFNF